MSTHKIIEFRPKGEGLFIQFLKYLPGKILGLAI